MTAVTSFMLKPSIAKTLTGYLLGLRLLGRGGHVGLRHPDPGHGERAATAGRRRELVRALRVLGHVDALDLDLATGAQADGLVDQSTDHVRHRERERRDDRARRGLAPQRIE